MSITHDYSTGDFQPESWRAKAKNAIAGAVRSLVAGTGDAAASVKAHPLHASDVASIVGYGLMALYAVTFVTRVAIVY